MLLPLALLASILLGFVSLAIFAGALYLLYRALRPRQRVYVSVETPAAVKTTRTLTTWPRMSDQAVWLPLLLGILLCLFSLGGRHAIQLLYPAGPDDPQTIRNGSVTNVKGIGGEDLNVETYGRPDGPVLLFTHGWGMDSTEWYYAKKHLSQDCRLVVWDLPGLGHSGQPQDKNFDLERMAANLHAVINSQEKPLFLIGHSIGGMINLTYCRLHPEALGSTVQGVIQVNTTYTNPVRTTKNSELSLALQKPVAEPILYAMIGLSPLVRVMNWFSYQNGTSFLTNAQSSFAGAGTRGQIDLVSRLQSIASPAVVARGTLAMFHWDAAPVLPRISIPVLILAGREDTTTLPTASETMLKSIPNAQIVEMSPAAHYSLLEQNGRVTEEIARFAQRIRGGVKVNE